MIDGNEVIINLTTPEQRVDDWEFAPGDVISLDVFVSTGEGLGVKECQEHDLIMGYPVLSEKAGEFVAQFKATVVVQPKSTAILCGGRALHGEDGIKSEHKIKDEELVKLLASELWKEEKVKKAKKWIVSNVLFSIINSIFKKT